MPKKKQKVRVTDPGLSPTNPTPAVSQTPDPDL